MSTNMADKHSSDYRSINNFLTIKNEDELNGNGDPAVDAGKGF